MIDFSFLADWIVLPGAALIFGAVLEAITRALDAALRLVLRGEEPSRRWRATYALARPFLLIAAGIVVGFVAHPLGAPVPEAFGTEVGGAVLTYALSATLALIGYDKIKAAVLASIHVYRARRNPELDNFPPDKL